MSNDFKFDNSKLKGLIEALGNKDPRIEIGVLGQKDIRKDGKSNAAIGAAHEYGAPAKNIPVRSFLRMPMTLFLNRKLESSKMFDEDTLKRVIKNKSMIDWFRTVARIAEVVVLEAFDSQGYGQWKRWKDPNYKNKTMKILQDETELRDSISSRIKE